MDIDLASVLRTLLYVRIWCRAQEALNPKGLGFRGLGFRV